MKNEKLVAILYALCMMVVISGFVACHALVVADKLYYQGSVAKSLPEKVEVTDSTFISTSHD